MWNLAQGAALYTQDFGTWADLNNAPLSAVGWVAAAPNPADNLIYSYGGISQFFTFQGAVNATNAYYTTNAAGSGPSGNVAFVAVDPAAYSNLTLAVRIQASYQSTNETVRFAVRVGGQWYASGRVLEQPLSGATYNEVSLAYQPAATNWLLLAIGNNGARIGGQPASPLSGLLSGVGIVGSWRGAAGSWNFSNFQLRGQLSDVGRITVGSRSPAGLTLSWSGHPQVHLQSSTNLSNRNGWRDLDNTAGLNTTTVATTAPETFYRLSTRWAIERGGDISEVTVEQQHGTIYCDENGVALSEPLTLCKIYGWTVARIRLFVNPPMTDFQVNSLSHAVDQAQRAKAQGMKIFLAMHYSDSWNNPGYHHTPAAWQGETYSQLLTTVSNYTVSVFNTFQSAGVLPEFVQIGNEPGNGFLWPAGGPILFTNGVPGPALQWSQFIGLVKAGISGVRAVSSTTKIMIHIPGGPWSGWCTDFFDAFTAACPNFDLVGISYYPDSTGSPTTDLSDITTTLNALHNRYPGKKLWIAETSYLWNWGSTTGIYPNTPAGQAAYATALCDLVASYSDGGGVCWWGCFDVANDHFFYNWAGQALFDSTWYTPDNGVTWRVNTNHYMLPAFRALGGAAH